MKMPSLAKKFLNYATAGTLAVSAVQCTAQPQQPAAAPVQKAKPVPYVTGETFEKEVFTAPGLVLVEFKADRCDACTFMEPHVDALAREMGSQLKVVKIDVDKSEDLRDELGVKIIPTVALFRQGEIVAYHESAMNREGLFKWTKDAMEEARRTAPKAGPARQTEALEVTDKTFEAEVTRHKGLVLVGLCSSINDACTDLKLDDIAQRDKIKVTGINLSENPVSAIRYGFDHHLPAMLVFKDGEVVAKLNTEQPWWQMVRQLEGVVKAVEEKPAAPAPAVPSLAPKP